MHLRINWLLSLAFAFIALSRLPVSSARSLPANNKETALISANNESTQSSPIPTTAPVHIQRIRRAKVEAPGMPFDFDTTHLACDMDSLALSKLIDKMPNQCIWIYNSRYASEAFFRAFKIYQLEAFFFGQYYDRFKRFEIGPHEFEDP